jgi:hypothetical protein
MHVICFSWIGVAVGEVGVDWGLAKVRRPRLRHIHIVFNQIEGDDRRECGFGSSAGSLQIAMVD